MQHLRVEVPGREYSLYIGRDITKERLADYFRKSSAKKCALISNDTLDKLYGEKITALFPENIKVDRVVITDGEKYKNLATVSLILDKLFEAELLRSDCVACLGGGVIGDIGAFAASIYLRGIDFIQMPISLLAMVDSSVGGKTGVNYPTSKNSIGTFCQPKLVIMDTAMLATLPKRQIHSGLAEILKHALIRDKAFFEEIAHPSFFDADLLSPSFEKILHRSCAIKADIVRQDERESGLRMLLNFGHTLGHLIETATNYSVYTHGEAVFGGMEFAAYLSFQKGYLREEEFRTVRDALSLLELKIELPAMSEADVVSIIARDKKNRHEGLNFVFLRTIGEAFSEKVNVGEVAGQFISFVRNESKLLKLAG